MNREELLEISNLGTICGIKKLLETLGLEYVFPRVSFYALEEGMFRPEESHFVMNSCRIFLDNHEIRFSDEKKHMSIKFNNERDSKYFYGNKLGQSMFSGEKLNYIEFSTEDYYIDIRFNLEKTE